MLDLKTILIVDLAVASLQAIAWIFVWLAWRHLYELKFLAAGFIAIAVGLLMMILRGQSPPPLSIVIDNTVIKLGLVLLAEGLARFLGQPRYSWIGIALLVFQVVVWSIAVAIDPYDLTIRIHSSTFFTATIMSVMCLALARDRTQPSLLRWITIALLVEYILASIVQSMMEHRWPARLENVTVLSDRHAWYLLQGCLFLIALFACLLFMVSLRLHADLREKNEALSQEVIARRRTEQQLGVSLETARRLSEERTDLMRVVSHEFRTPLAIIRNAVDMIDLTGGRLPEATTDRLAGIREALGRLFSLIDRFLANDRDSNFRPEMMQLASLVADIQLHFDMTGRGGRLDILAENETALIFIDPEMLATAVINLIDNALKYSQDDQLVAMIARADGEFLIIEVRDHGIGIPEAEWHKLGQRFFRASNTQPGTGTGLGLYAARKLLSFHDGTLEMRRNEPAGTIAVARVPLPAVHAAVSTSQGEA